MLYLGNGIYSSANNSLLHSGVKGMRKDPKFLKYGVRIDWSNSAAIPDWVRQRQGLAPRNDQDQGWGNNKTYRLPGNGTYGSAPSAREYEQNLRRNQSSHEYGHPIQRGKLNKSPSKAESALINMRLRKNKNSSNAMKAASAYMNYMNEKAQENQRSKATKPLNMNQGAKSSGGNVQRQSPRDPYAKNTARNAELNARGGRHQAEKQLAESTAKRRHASVNSSNYKDAMRASSAKQNALSRRKAAEDLVNYKTTARNKHNAVNRSNYYDAMRASAAKQSAVAGRKAAEEQMTRTRSGLGNLRKVHSKYYNHDIAAKTGSDGRTSLKNGNPWNSRHHGDAMRASAAKQSAVAGREAATKQMETSRKHRAVNRSNYKDAMRASAAKQTAIAGRDWGKAMVNYSTNKPYFRTNSKTTKESVFRKAKNMINKDGTSSLTRDAAKTASQSKKTSYGRRKKRLPGS